MELQLLLMTFGVGGQKTEDLLVLMQDLHLMLMDLFFLFQEEL